MNYKILPYSKTVLKERKNIFLFGLVNIVILNGPTTVVHVIFFYNLQKIGNGLRYMKIL